jgi:uncharacterized protein (TIGR04255 family)
MPFPKTPRVIYDKNPLQQVICQLRFPTVLKIEVEKPGGFQEQIRSDYPYFMEKTRSIPEELQRIIPREFEDVFPSERRLTYEFKSADEKWAISLTRDFIAFASLEYHRWENFFERLEIPLQALLDHYQPAFFTRVGLRYQDIIQRSALGLGDVDWCELLQPQIAGALMRCDDEDVKQHVKNTVTEVVIGLENDRNQVRIKHGLIEKNDESCYLIDSDFFTEERTETENVRDVLNYFGARGSRLFRWCITARLHEAMEPRAI